MEARTPLRCCTKCNTQCTNEQFHNSTWLLPQCKNCYNKRKRDDYAKKNKTITCPVCKVELKALSGARSHKDTKKHQNNMTLKAYDALPQEEKSILLLYF